MSAVTSSVFFLFNLGIDLSQTMMNSLGKKKNKTLIESQILEGSGVGINQFTLSLKEILQDLKISQS